ncbi:hypothetical protein SEA_SBLACKBERRY_14 [Microbacterium phage SBlackberry]|nr:hypothetical protein SEA_ZANELLA_14 [Microbacterium phage Zanella]UAW08759.1 hypothetical protein SEA_SBLACKBERRY_14 [Microbacterium phage SBlackberry]URM86924.1 hypothetical protein SEA_TYPHER_16 [Microbacterium phage Typher]UVK60345.1 hypothetical protein SEA_TURBOVICKY_14 [Microbacterium phage TurboVicky]
MSASFAFKWEEDNIDEVKAVIMAAILEGLLMAGEHILNVSNAQAPIEDGDLIRSGVVSSSSASEKTVAVSYDTPYAVIQHEDLTLRHDAGRNAKFLANACKSEASTAGKIVATRVKRVVGS